MRLVELVIGLFWPGGASVAHGVTNAISLAALTPIAYWFLEHKEETAVCATWGQLALAGGAAYFFLKLAQFSQAPRREDPLGNWRGGPPL